MVLRSGIIIPFQFRDIKKLLMIGVPEENRILSIWDLKNVVRAAFGIYNFEFRNKKIGFNIPDELLLHYLAQRHDLTNFVLEIIIVHDANVKIEKRSRYSLDPSVTVQKLHVPQPLRSNESLLNESSQLPSYATGVTLHARSLGSGSEGGVKSPLDVVAANHSDHSASNHEMPPRLRISQVFSEQTPESLTQSIDPMDILPKAEHDDGRMERDPQEHQQLQQQQQTQQDSPAPQYFPNFGHGHGMLGTEAPSTPSPQQLLQPQQICTPGPSRFRRRGERMSKDQKELYVKYFEDNPCMLNQRRNDVMLEPHWNKLASLLNSVPQGAVKNVEEWKQTFDAWRYRVFMYTRYNSKLSGPAAHNLKNYKPLTNTDQRAYAMWTSHKGTAPQDFIKIDMFGQMDETQADYDY